MRKLATETRTTLAGGDTSESPADLILADIVLVGTAPRGRALRRSTAQPGDQIYVTGSLGGAHAELMALLSANRASKAKPQDVHPHFYPQPRLSVGKELLRRRIATSAIDLSDGLSTDLAHLCESSGVRAEVSSASLPLHALTQKLSRKDALHAALNGGEDYELLFSAPPTAHVPKKIAGVPITRIGSIHRKTANRARVTLVDEDGRRNELRAAGWEHLTGR
jgi:thiamine-monophosphate kinase